MGTGYKNRGSGAAGLGFKNRGAKLVEGAAYTNRGATDGTNETFKNRGQAWGSDLFYNRAVNDFGSLSSPLNASTFYAPLKSTLVLTRGTGDPTYSRATSAWEFDNEGKLITVPSDSARFGGARMVRNLLPTGSENLTLWHVNTGTPVITTAIGIDGSSKQIKIAEADATTITAIRTPSITTVAGNTYLVTFYVLKESDVSSFPDFDFAVQSFRLNKSTGAVSVRTGTTTPTVTEVTRNGVQWWYVSLLYTDIAGSPNRRFYITPAITTNWALDTEASAVGNVTVDSIQIEDVTGQADQTASEYVSVGVLSAPYHGAGVDGVKWFNTNKDGSAISESSLLGYHAEGARTNSLLYSRDLTNAAWVATNITAAKTATGIDNAANRASTLTAGAADATILQTLSLAAAARSSSAYVKRRTGTGNIYFTRDGGTSWTDITASVGASWTRVKIENTSALNPSIGFKIATSGDAIDVDCVQDEAGAYITSPIVTTTAAVTRNADSLTYQTASNWSDTAGWMLASVYKPDWSYVAGGVIGSATNGLLPLTTNTGAKAYDGTNTVNGPAGSPSGTVKMAATWGSGALQVAANGTAGTAGSYDGAWGLATIGINTSAGAMYTKNVYIDDAAITAAQLQQVTA